MKVWSLWGILALGVVLGVVAVLKLSSSINKLSKTILSGNIKCIDYFDFLSYDETILAPTSSDESSKKSNFSDISNTSSLTICINASPSYLNVIYPLSECVNGDGPQTESLDLNYLALQNSSLNPIANPFTYTGMSPGFLYGSC